MTYYTGFNKKHLIRLRSYTRGKIKTLYCTPNMCPEIHVLRDTEPAILRFIGTG